MPSDTDTINRVLTGNFNESEAALASTSETPDVIQKRLAVSHFLSGSTGLEAEDIYGDFDNYFKVNFGDVSLDDAFDSARHITGPPPETLPKGVSDFERRAADVIKSVFTTTAGMIGDTASGVLSLGARASESQAPEESIRSTGALSLSTRSKDILRKPKQTLSFSLDKKAFEIAESTRKLEAEFAPSLQATQTVQDLLDQEYGAVKQLMTIEWYTTKGVSLVVQLAPFMAAAKTANVIAKTAFTGKKLAAATGVIAGGIVAPFEATLESGGAIRELQGRGETAKRDFEITEVMYEAIPKEKRDGLLAKSLLGSMVEFQKQIDAGADERVAGQVASRVFQDNLGLLMLTLPLEMGVGGVAVSSIFRGSSRRQITTAVGGALFSLGLSGEEEVRQKDINDFAITEGTFGEAVRNNFLTVRALEVMLFGTKEEQDTLLGGLLLGMKSTVPQLVVEIGNSKSMAEAEARIKSTLNIWRNNAENIAKEGFDVAPVIDAVEKERTLPGKIKILQKAAQDVTQKNIETLNEQLAVEIEERLIFEEQTQVRETAAKVARKGRPAKKKKELTPLEVFHDRVKKQGGINNAKGEDLAGIPRGFKLKKGRRGLSFDEALAEAESLNIPVDVTQPSELVRLLTTEVDQSAPAKDLPLSRVPLGTSISLPSGDKFTVVGRDTDGNILLANKEEVIRERPEVVFEGEFSQATAAEVEALIAEHGEDVQLEIDDTGSVISSATARNLERLGLKKVDDGDFTAFSKKEPLPERGVTPEVLQERIKALGFDGLNIKVFGNAGQVEGGEGLLSISDNTIEGIFNRKTNTVVLIAERIDPSRVDAVILHEVAGHLGLRAVLGEDGLTKVLEQLKGERGFESIVDAEEALARAAEDPNIDPGLLQRIYAAIRQVLRDLGFTQKFTDNDIKALLARSRVAAERASTQEVGRKADKVSDSDVRFSLLTDQRKMAILAEKTDSEKIFTAAKEHFGTTKDINETGWVLPDGTMLDMSKGVAGKRRVEHETVKRIKGFPKEATTDEGFNAFRTDKSISLFLQLGAMRIDPAIGSIELGKKPTPGQFAAIREIVDTPGQAVFVEMFDLANDELFNGPIADKKVIGTIRRFYAGQEVNPDDVRFSKAPHVQQFFNWFKEIGGNDFIFQGKPGIPEVEFLNVLSPEFKELQDKTSTYSEFTKLAEEKGFQGVVAFDDRVRGEPVFVIFGDKTAPEEGVNITDAVLRQAGVTELRADSDVRFSKAPPVVSGLKVREDIPNLSSIDATIPNARILPGIQEVPFSDFTLDEAPISKDKRVLELAEQIKQSGEINPLIVGIDEQGPYIIEGANRFDALKVLGKKSFPAVVVEEDSDVRFSKAPPVESKAFKDLFEGSKVVDENGKPLQVFHGTAEAGLINDEFDKALLGSVTKSRSAKAGFFFVDNKRVAISFSRLANEKPVQDLISQSEAAERKGNFDLANELMAKAEKLEATATPKEKVIGAYLVIKKPFEFDADGERFLDVQDKIHEAIREAKKGDFDGIVFRNLVDSADFSDHIPADHYIAFEPTQVLQVPEDPDIRFSKQPDLRQQQEIIEDIELDIAGRLFAGKKVLTSEVARELKKSNIDAKQATNILKGARAISEFLTERSRKLEPGEDLLQNIEKELETRAKEGFKAGEFTEQARARVKARRAAAVAEPTKKEILSKKAAASVKLESLNNKGFDLSREIENVKIKETPPAKKKPARKKEEPVFDEEEIGGESEIAEVFIGSQRAKPEVKALGREELDTITDTIKKTITDPAEYKYAFAKALKAAARRLTFGRDRETINNRIIALESLNSQEKIDAAIDDIIQRINKRRIRDNVDTLMEVVTRFLNIKKIKRQQSRTQELIRDDLHPEERRWLKLVRNIYKKGKNSVDLELREVEKFLNSPESMEDSQAAKDFLDKRIEFAPSLKDQFFKSIPIDEVGKYYYKVLSQYGSLQSRSPVEILGAINEMQEDLDTGIKRIEAEIEARDKRLEAKRSVFIDAIESTKRIRREGVEDFTNRFFEGVFSLRNRLLDAARFGDESKRAAFVALVDEIEASQTAANTKEQTEKRLALERLSEAIKKIYKVSHSADTIDELNKVEDKYSKYSIDGIALSKGYLLQIYGQLTQEDYAEQLKKRQEYFGESYLTDILKELSKQDVALLQWLRDDAEAARPSLSAVSEKVLGVPVVSPGENYLPAAMERAGGLPEQHISVEIVPKSLTPRTKNNLDIKEDVGILDMWSTRINDNAHFKHHVELNQELRGIFAHPDVQKTIKKIHGDGTAKDILEHVADHMTGGFKDKTKLQALDKVRGFITLTGLSANVGVMTRQITSVPAFGFRIGLADTTKHFLNFWDPDKWNPEKGAVNWETVKIIWNSDERKNRFQGGNEEQVNNALQNLSSNLFMKWFRAGMVTNSLGDIAPTLIIGTGIYQTEFAKNLKSMGEPEAKAKALNTLFSIVQATQQSKEQKDLAIWQRRLGVGGRFLGQFKSTQKQFAEFEVLALRDLLAKRPGSGKKILNVLAINHVLLPLAYNIVGALYSSLLAGFPDDDEKDELLDRLVVSMLAGPVSGLVFFGGLVEDTVHKLATGKEKFFKSSLPAQKIEDIAGGFFFSLVNLAQGDLDEALEEFDKFLRGATPVYRDLRKLYKGRFE